MKKLMLALALLLLFSGCAKNLSPFSPENKQRIRNENGKIDDIQNNQQGFLLEMQKLKADVQDVKNFQQGNFNKSSENNGVQILQGDGALITVFALVVIGSLLVYHYKTKSDKHEQAANILAQQIAMHDNLELENKIFLAAMHTDSEETIYKLMVKNQKKCAAFRR
jgi:hypothetical protein